MKALRRLTVLAFLLVATPVFAQTGSGILGDRAGLLVEPIFPEPGENTTVTLSGLNSQLFNANIVWSLNGETVADANNQREMEFIAGELGSSDVVEVAIVQPSGGAQYYSVEIKPTYVDIVLEAQTRTPDFYQGRAVPSVGSQVNATVLVNDGQLLTGDYVYTWRLNGEMIGGGSVRGTNQISFDTPRGSRPILSVKVTELSGQLVGERAIYYRSVRPEMAFYETNALYGQSHNAISGRLPILSSAATIVAEPYFLDIRTYNEPDVLEWEIDDNPQTNTGANPYQITVQKVTDGGSASLSFHVRSTSELLQGTQKSLNVSF